MKRKGRSGNLNNNEESHEWRRGFKSIREHNREKEIKYPRLDQNLKCLMCGKKHGNIPCAVSQMTCYKSGK